MERVNRKTRCRLAREGGLTLIELMVVVAIVAVMMMLAVPVFTKDRIESDFNAFVRTFAHDIRRSHAAAIGSRDDRQFLLFSDRYQINTLTRIAGASPVPNLLVNRQAPEGVVIAGVLATDSEPGTSYPRPSGSTFAGNYELRLEATGGFSHLASAGSGNPVSSTATVFFRTLRGNHQARLVIYPATCHAKLYDQW